MPYNGKNKVDRNVPLEIDSGALAVVFNFLFDLGLIPNVAVRCADTTVIQCLFKQIIVIREVPKV